MTSLRACVFHLDKINPSSDKKTTLFKQGVNTVGIDISPADNNDEPTLYTTAVFGKAKLSKDQKTMTAKNGLSFTMTSKDHAKNKVNGPLQINPIGYTAEAKNKKGVTQTAHGTMKIFNFKSPKKSLKKNDFKLLANFVEGLTA